MSLKKTILSIIASIFCLLLLSATADPGTVAADRLKLWLRSTEGITLDTTSSTATVSRWGNLAPTGAAWDCVQPTKANQMTYDPNALNGLPGVKGDGTNDYCDFSAEALAFLNGKSGGTAYVVWKGDPTSGSRVLLFVSTGTSTTNSRWTLDTNNAFQFCQNGRRLDADSIAYNCSASNVFSKFGWYYAVDTFDATNNDAVNYLLGTAVATNTSFSTSGAFSATDSQRMRLFADGSGASNHNDSIVEVALWDRVLTQPEREQLYAYSEDRYFKLPEYVLTRPNLKAFYIPGKSVATLVAGEVDGLTDLTGNANLTADSSTERPVLDDSCINGRDCLRFTADVLKNASGFPATGSYTKLIVEQPDVTTAAGYDPGNLFSGATDDALWHDGVATHATDITRVKTAHIGANGYATQVGKFLSESHNPKVVVETWDDSAHRVKIYENGILSLDYTSAAARASDDDLQLGGFAGANQHDGVLIGAAAAFNAVLSDADRNLLTSEAMDYYSINPLLVVWLGDSISTSDYVTNELEGLPYQVMELVGPTTKLDIRNLSVSGRRLDTLLTDYNADYANFAADTLHSGKVLVVWAGTNDIADPGDVSYQNGQSAFFELLTLLKQAKNTGNFTQYLILTGLPRENNATLTNAIFKMNDNIRSACNAAGGGGGQCTDGILTDLLDTNEVFVVNTQALTQFDAAGDCTNTTYFNNDTIHPKAAGYELIDNLVQSVMGW